MDHPSDTGLVKVLLETQILSYVVVSALVVLVYDSISMFPQEVTYILRAKWTLPKVLYLLLRYLGLCQAITNVIVWLTVQTSVQRCRVYFVFSVSVRTPTFLSLLVNGILAMRLYALYGRSMKVLCFLWLLFLGEFAVQLYIAVKIGMSSVNKASVPPSDTPIPGCLLTDSPELSELKIIWIVSIFVSCISQSFPQIMNDSPEPMFQCSAACFFMTLAKFFRSTQESGHAVWRIRFQPLVMAFIRDDTIYFLAVVITLTAGAVSSSLVSGPLMILYEPWVVTSLVVAGSRLVLNLREAAVREVSLPNDFMFYSESGES